MKRTRILFSFFIFILICSMFSSIFASTLSDETAKLEQSISSNSVLIMENSTGKIIYEKNGYEKRYPASTTKILTAILAIENCNLNENVTASEYAIMSIPSGYSTANIQIGETLSVKDLLYVLMLQSANESAVILAEHVSGSMDAFSDLMNKKAEEIGCQNTHFVNPNGVHNENHYSTAYDLALIAQYAMKNPTFREIVKTTSYTLPTTPEYPNDNRTFINTNNLIIYDKRERTDTYYYEYATGIKTGYTSAAKNCLVSSATKDGMDYICVVLGADIIYGNTGTVSCRYVDTISLFNYAFDNFSFRKINNNKSTIKTIQVENATKDTKDLDLLIDKDVTALVSIDNKDSVIEPEIVLNDNLQAPISKGDVVGKLSYNIEGLVYTTNLIAGSDVKEFKPITLFLYLILVLLLLVFTAFGIRFYNLRRKCLKNKFKYVKKDF